jgi:hypothetical protein
LDRETWTERLGSRDLDRETRPASASRYKSLGP